MKGRKVMALVLITATLAHADVPRTLERRRDIELALLANTRDRGPGNAVLGLGVASLIIAAMCGAWGIGLAMEDAARLSVGAVLWPVTGRLPAPANSSQVESLFGVTLATGIGGLASIITGLVMRQVMAPASQRKSLLLEQARLDGELRAEQRLSVNAPAPSEEVPIEVAPAPLPPPGLRRAPLRPRAAPTGETKM